MPVKQIQIKSPLWGGSSIFHYGKKEPWVGVALDKLGDEQEATLVLQFRPDKPTYTINTKEFSEYALGKGWSNINGGHECAYVPLSELPKLAVKDKS